jgi:hypothetical protein
MSLTCYRCGDPMPARMPQGIPIAWGAGRYAAVCSMRCARRWKLNAGSGQEDYKAGHGPFHRFTSWRAW